MRTRRRLRSVAAVLAVLAAHAAGAAAPVADEARAQAEREGRARVIVRLAAEAAVSGEPSAGRAQKRAAIEQAADAALARIGGPGRGVLRRYRALPLLALELSPRELVELAAAPEVLAIEADRQNFPSLGQSVPYVGADLTAAAGWDGAGSAVAILDTGVESSHPFLEGRVVAEACFSSGDDCPNGNDTQFGGGSAVPCSYGSLCYHGTHVAGIAAGRNPNGHGVAPGASLIAIQIGSRLTGSECGTAGSPCVTLYDSDAIAALDYVADTLAGDWNVASVNMSFGSTSTWSSESACEGAYGAFENAAAAIRALGIAPVAASGNGSATTGISSPGCLPSVIGVGASFDNSDAIWVKSNSGPPLDLLAPGTNIYSSVLGGSYEISTGTSMAAPHVAGAFAVLHQADPTASVSTLKAALESTGIPVSDPRNGLVRPRLQMDAAVRSRAPAACFDGLDNDLDGYVDVDGDGGTPDPDCTDGFDTAEAPLPPPPGCGIGPELALLLPLLTALRRRCAPHEGNAAR
jgi:subtilisin family serine protease